LLLSHAQTSRTRTRLPARIYDLRATFASDALAANVSVFRLARVMGTSVRMIERHYGALLDGAGADIADRLDALDFPRFDGHLTAGPSGLAWRMSVDAQDPAVFHGVQA
jgi:hypothetical protein